MLESNIESLPLVHRGKVRDIYAVDDAHLLFVATDRISAFDVVLPNPIPDKGIVLTRLSCFWFERFASRVPNHLTGIDPASVVSAAEAARIDGRALVVKR
ncbi:MAG: phosphoribosylaminoimidazolesuccinocarboxamide synthase, partial [Gammaproteobacteria bacterium]|nr:phosphoribosylaminoimidazolesuccinocarboxamide synthase [Gammaproteobacteria bacterium]